VQKLNLNHYYENLVRTEAKFRSAQTEKIRYWY